jgi:NADH-quinone oxidoreductase subunit I
MPLKTITRKDLTLVEKTYLPGVLAGLWVTLKNAFRKPITLEYPEQKPPTPPGYRGAPTLVRDETGRVKCVSCQLCEFVCPPKAIRITPSEIPADAPNAKVEKTPKAFEIDMLRCVYCGLCEEVCPEEAIFLQNLYSINARSRAEALYDKSKLLELGGVRPDATRKWDKK